MDTVIYNNLVQWFTIIMAVFNRLIHRLLKVFLPIKHYHKQLQLINIITVRIYNAHNPEVVERLKNNKKEN